MHTGVTGQIRKTAVGRWVLYHINTGLFWIYGILTFALAFSLSGFWIQSGRLRCLLSLPVALCGAFTLAQIIRALFWRRFRNVWMDNYVIAAFLAAWLLSKYAHDIRDGRADALHRLVIHALTVIVAGLISYASSRKNAA